MQVTLVRSGTVFGCLPDESLLDAATRQEVWLPSACKNGTCGSCKSRVLSGQFRHDENARALSKSEMEGSFALLCCAFAEGDIALDLEELKARPDADRPPLPARVIRLEKLTESVALLTLRLPPNQKLEFTPGQYVGINWQDGVMRSFSIANAPREDNTIDLHVGRIPNGLFTGHVFDEMAANAVLRIRGPFGQFAFAQNSSPVVFVAGGTGIAPILSILETFASDRPGAPMRLYWGSRFASGLYLDGRLRELAASLPNLEYIPVLSDDDGAAWNGRRGFVHQAVVGDIADLTDFEVYACGSPLMIDAARSAFFDHGLAPERFYSDSFHLPKAAAGQEAKHDDDSRSHNLPS